MDLKKIDNIIINGGKGLNMDFVDSYIESADYDGVKMTIEQLDEINENTEFVYQCVHNWFF